MAGIEPGELRLHYSAHGKPYMMGEQPEPEIMFNFSQTKRAAICCAPGMVRSV